MADRVFWFFLSEAVTLSALGCVQGRDEPYNRDDGKTSSRDGSGIERMFDNGYTTIGAGKDWVHPRAESAAPTLPIYSGGGR